MAEGVAGDEEVGGGGPLAGHTPIVVDDFGGLCTLFDKSDLPMGLAAYANNIEFFPGGFRSRSPFALQMTDSSSFVGTVVFITPAGLRKRLVLETNGSLKKEYPEGTLTAITTIIGDGLSCSHTHMYGKAVLCFSNGKYGLHPPLQYNDTNLRRVSISGPGLAPTVADGAAGSISAGHHYFAYAFLTDTGYLTRPSPWADLNAAGSKKADISALALGPAGTTARVVFVTAAYVSAQTAPTGFYNLPSFIVPDNTTTTLTVDFTDSQLLGSLEVTGDALYRRDILPPQLGVTHYDQRMIYYGGVSLIQEDPYWNTLVNFSFNGGFTGNIPNSWTQVVAGVTSSTPAGAVGSTIRLTGDGVTATTAKIESGVVARPTVPSGLSTGTAYSVRVRVRRSSTFTTGGAQLTIAATGPTATLNIPVSSIGTTWSILSGELFTSAMTLDTTTRIQVGLTSAAAMTGSDYVEINDGIQPYPTDDPYTQDELLVSDIGDPEAIDAITGRVSVAPDNGEFTRAAFVLRQNLYVGKEHSIYSVTDVAEFPSDWPVAEVDSSTGIPCPNAVATSEGVAVFIDRAGAYLFDGGLPQKISTEIDGTWRAIDKTLLHKSWVVIDPRLRRVFFAVPTTSSLIGQLCMLDFVEGFGDPLASPGHGRKWSIWDGLTNYAAGDMEERSDGTYVFLAAGNTNIGTNYIASSVDFAFTPWVTDHTAWVVTAAQADPLGGTSATQWAAGAAGPNNAYVGTTSLTLADNDYVTAAIWIKSAVTITDCTFRVLRIGGPGTTTLGTTTLDAVTSGWTRFPVGGQSTGGAGGTVRVELIFPTGTPTVIVFGVQLSLTRYDQGYVATSGAVVTTGTAAGVLARLVDLSSYEAFVNANDFNQGIDPRYETAPLGPEVGRSHYGMLTVRVTGNGSLVASLVNAANTNDSLPAGSVVALPVKIMRDGRVTSAAKYDLEIGCNETETQLGVRLETENGIGQYSVKSLALFARKAPFSWLRGHN